MIKGWGDSQGMRHACRCEFPSPTLGALRLGGRGTADETASVIKEVASKESTILTVTHFDADGLTAGAIAFEAIRRLNTTVHLRIVENLSEKTVEEIGSIDADFIVFSDIGSGYLDILS